MVFSQLDASDKSAFFALLDECVYQSLSSSLQTLIYAGTSQHDHTYSRKPLRMAKAQVQVMRQSRRRQRRPLPQRSAPLPRSLRLPCPRGLVGSRSHLPLRS
jgi:hypothetical protein